MRSLTGREYGLVFFGIVVMACVLLYVIDTSRHKYTESVVGSRPKGRRPGQRINNAASRIQKKKGPSLLSPGSANGAAKGVMDQNDEIEQSGDSSSGSGFGSGGSGESESRFGSGGSGEPEDDSSDSPLTGSAAEKKSGEGLTDASVPGWLAMLLESDDVKKGKTDDHVLYSKKESVKGKLVPQSKGVNAKRKIPGAKIQKGAKPAIPKNKPLKPPSKGEQPAQGVNALGINAQGVQAQGVKAQGVQTKPREQDTMSKEGLVTAGDQPGMTDDMLECSAVRAQYLAAKCAGSPDLSDVMKRVANSGKSNRAMMRAQRKMRAGTRLLVSDLRGVILCASAKCASTSLKALMALSAGGVTPGEKILSHNKTYLNQHNLYLISDYSPRAAAKRLNTYTKFITVRHPFDRLLSAYEDKVMSNLEPFTQYFKSANGTKLTFPQFLGKLVAQYPRTPFSINAHWFPYSPACDPCHVMYDHVLRLETFEEDLPFLQRHLPGANGNGTLEVPHRKMNAKRPEEKLTQVTERFRQINPKTIKGLLKIYRYDFELFGYAWDDKLGASYGVQNASQLVSPTRENQRIC